MTVDRLDFEALLAEHAARVYAFVHRLVGADQADDACQEVWLAIHRGLPRFRGESKVTTWMFSIATRVCRSYRRRRRAPLCALEDDAAEAVTDPDRGPEESALDAELAAIVREAIDLLPAGQREVVHLRQLEDCSYAEIAEILSVAVGTVRSRLHYGMAKLADLLAPYLEIHDEAE